MTATVQTSASRVYFCNFDESELSPLDRGGMAVTKPSLDAEYAKRGITYVSSFDVP